MRTQISPLHFSWSLCPHLGHFLTFLAPLPDTLASFAWLQSKPHTAGCDFFFFKKKPDFITPNWKPPSDFPSHVGSMAGSQKPVLPSSASLPGILGLMTPSPPTSWPLWNSELLSSVFPQPGSSLNTGLNLNVSSKSLCWPLRLKWARLTGRACEHTTRSSLYCGYHHLIIFLFMCCLPHRKVGTLTSATSEPTWDGGWPPGVLMKHSHDGTMTGLPQGAVA